MKIMKLLLPLLTATALPLIASCTMGRKNSPQLTNTINYSGPDSGSIIEGQRSMTGRILLPAPSEGIYVQIFTSSDEKIKAVWPGWNYAMFVKPRWHGTDIANTQQRKFVVDQAASKIDPSQEYNIELLTRNHANSRVVFNDILRVSKNDQIVIDASICQVHKLPMKRQIEKTCSADSYPESFFKQQKREFPNDGNVYLGCGSGRDLTWKCSECSRDYELWAKRHGWKQ